MEQHRDGRVGKNTIINQFINVHVDLTCANVSSIIPLKNLISTNKININTH